MVRTFSALAVLMMAACGGDTDSDPAATPSATDTARQGSSEASADAPRGAESVWITLDQLPDGAIASDGQIAFDADGRPLAYALLGEPLPEFTGPMLDGDSFGSDDFDGRWTIVDVWGLWCGDCLADAPYAAALARAVDQDPDLDFLSIHTPPSAERADEAFGKYDSIEAFFTSKGYRYPTLVDADARIRETLRIDWTPTYLLIAPDTTVQAFSTDLSVRPDAPVKDLLQETAEIRGQWKRNRGN